MLTKKKETCTSCKKHQKVIVISSGVLVLSVVIVIILAVTGCFDSNSNNNNNQGDQSNQSNQLPTSIGDDSTVSSNPKVSLGLDQNSSSPQGETKQEPELIPLVMDDNQLNGKSNGGMQITPAVTPPPTDTTPLSSPRSPSKRRPPPLEPIVDIDDHKMSPPGTPDSPESTIAAQFVSLPASPKTPPVIEEPKPDMRESPQTSPKTPGAGIEEPELDMHASPVVDAPTTTKMDDSLWYGIMRHSVRKDDRKVPQDQRHWVDEANRPYDPPIYDLQVNHQKLKQ